MLLKEVNKLIRAAVTLPSGNSPAYSQSEGRLHALLDTLAKPVQQLDELRRVHRFKADDNVRLESRVVLEQVWTGLRARIWCNLGRLDRLVYDYMIVPTSESRREVLGACSLMVGDGILLADLLGHEAIELLYRLETELRVGADESVRSIPPLTHAVTSQDETIHELRVELAKERMRADRLELELRNVRRAGH